MVSFLSQAVGLLIDPSTCPSQKGESVPHSSRLYRDEWVAGPKQNAPKGVFNPMQKRKNPALRYQNLQSRQKTVYKSFII
jgi:hypothetical protein